MPVEYLKIKKAAFALLAKREHSVQELRNKLLIRKYNESVVSRVLSELEQENYLSDERFAEMMLRHRFSRGNGPKRILYDLKQKGVSEKLIQNALQIFEGDWFKLAQEVRQKRFGAHLGGDFREKSKQMRFLAARGFEAEHIESAFDA